MPPIRANSVLFVKRKRFRYFEESLLFVLAISTLFRSVPTF